MNYSALGQWVPLEAIRYQESACRVLELIRSVYQHKQVTSDQLIKALVELGLSPDVLYRQLSAGYETPQLNALALALGLPEKSLCSSPPPPQSFELAMQQLVNQAGESATSPDDISQGILRLAEEIPQSVKPKQRVPYYQRNKAQSGTCSLKRGGACVDGVALHPPSMQAYLTRLSQSIQYGYTRAGYRATLLTK